ncbi:hydrogenase maturation protease [Bryocella elongata]|uniref:Hydrogenase maturation protease n=1 Tax=Bryocella elongata TaxID=863522 RepID=A0A1H5VXJ0_9BACT|nr:hydrogenase maturation protease [Bryocella elongata]SEF91853.1 hydrogenase maturation protease [Bryocella elongata]
MTDRSLATRGVLGLGNLMRMDDAVGMLALDELEASPELPRNVRLVEGGTLGLEIMGRIDGLTHIVALDAVDFGAEPGTVARFAGKQLLNLPVSKSVHLLGFADLLAALQLLGTSPEEIVLLGVQPGSTDWGTVPTAPVRAAMATLVNRTLEQLAQWEKTSPSTESQTSVAGSALAQV